MNTKIRSLLIAVPLATAALTVGIPGAASATDQPGPIIAQPVGGDPKPMDFGVPTPAPEPDPAPQLPGDKAPVPQDEDPQLPDDKAPVPQDEPGNGPEGPGDISNGEPCPTHGVDCTPEDGEEDGEEPDQGCFTDCDLPEEPAEEVSTFVTPTRVDAGLGAHEDGGLELAWLLAGGALVTAAGGATVVARRRARTEA